VHATYKSVASVKSANDKSIAKDCDKNDENGMPKVGDCSDGQLLSDKARDRKDWLSIFNASNSDSMDN